MANLAYTLVLGKPLILYLGIFTLFSFSFTALVGYLNYKGKSFLPLKWHLRLALLSLLLAVLHALFGLSAYL